MKPKSQIQARYRELLDSLKPDLDPVFQSVIQAKIDELRWALDQESTVLESDDCIMDETVVCSIPLGENISFGVEGAPNSTDVKIQDLEPPYRDLLKGLKLNYAELPLQMRGKFQVAQFVIYPNGSVSRNIRVYNEDDAIKDGGFSATVDVQKRLQEELKDRYCWNGQAEED